MQTGISFAVGQLLAVVAPRTVLVVDAPTDWSLAGPLWELALDDAPVDEILDVLIRRGIRTAPSFAIVRVESDAVRALVRGSVPVCFERSGEPVRLDATGATSWLEGLISGAHRVLVGAVDSTTPMPFLVSTGVVLVSGLALPTGFAPGQDEPVEPGSRADLDLSPSALAAEPASPVVVAGSDLDEESPLAVSGSSARVVDLTRSGNRSSRTTPPADDAEQPAEAAAPSDEVAAAVAPAERPASDPADAAAADKASAAAPAPAESPRPSWPLGPRSGEPVYLNGHASAGAPEADAPSPAAESFAAPESPSVGVGPLKDDLADASFGAPAADEAEPSDSADPADADDVPPVHEPAGSTSSRYEPSELDAPIDTSRFGSRYDSPIYGSAEPASEPAAPPSTDPSRLDSPFASPAAFEQPVAPSHSRPTSQKSDPFAPPPFEWSFPPADDDADRPDVVDLTAAERADQARAASHVDADASDLLTDEEPSGPSPVDLPSFSPPSMSLKLPSLKGSPAAPIAPAARFQPTVESPPAGLGAPDAWPPLFPSERERLNGSGARAGYPNGSNGYGRDPFAPEPEAGPATGSQLPEPDASSFFAAPAPAAPAEQADPAESDSAATDVTPEAAPLAKAVPADTFARTDAHIGDRHASPDRFDADRFDADHFDDGHFDADHFEADRLDAGRVDDGRVDPGHLGGGTRRADAGRDDELARLPFRVRGQSLRPEQREPLRSPSQPDGYLPDDPPLIPSPEGIPSPSRPASPAAGGQAASPAAQPMSGSLLLPAFFRGARAARSKPAAPAARTNGQPNGQPTGQPFALRGPSPSDQPDSRPVTPSNWSPPLRRVFPDRSGPAGGSAAGAPPATPGVLRTGGTGTSSPAYGVPGASPDSPSGGVRTPEPPREPPRLLGVWCDAGHVTSPDRPECRVCGLPVPPQAPILVARPPLGVLVFDNGDRVVVDRPVVLGRDPKPVASPDPEAPVLHAVQSATGQVSRTHAEVRASGWDVVLTDLEAMNGTALTAPGASPVAIEPGVPTVLAAGCRVDLGGESGFVFEIEA